MLNYDKTALGLEALQERSIQLTARQRRLLVLIGSDDFALLNNTARQRFAPPELLQQLLDMGLISTKILQHVQPHDIDHHQQTHHELSTTPSILEENLPSFKKLISATETLLHKIIESKPDLQIEIHSSSNQCKPMVRQSYTVQERSDLPKKTHIYDVEAHTIEELTALNFEDVKFLMMQTLHQHCGLLARHLIQHIRTAPDIQCLKKYQMQWLTHLQETRICATELNQILRLINLSLKNQ